MTPCASPTTRPYGLAGGVFSASLERDGRPARSSGTSKHHEHVEVGVCVLDLDGVMSGAGEDEDVRGGGGLARSARPTGEIVRCLPDDRAAGKLREDRPRVSP